ncbi:MAG: hypothetical protein CMI32_03170, partial [Opitutales bacterium]|nr:hypothetical protein [Opitutales bacterium]
MRNNEVITHRRTIKNENMACKGIKRGAPCKGLPIASFLTVNDAHHTERSQEGGFALALSLALLSFLALLILALVALIGVEARVAESTRSHRLAREHAKVAMRIA